MTVLGFNAAFEKQPSEVLTISANFADVASNLVVSGYGLNACDLKIYGPDGSDTGNNMIEGTLTTDGNNSRVLVTVKAGNDGGNYYARFRTTWTKGGQPDQIIERDLLIEVRERGF